MLPSLTDASTIMELEPPLVHLPPPRLHLASLAQVAGRTEMVLRLMGVNTTTVVLIQVAVLQALSPVLMQCTVVRSIQTPNTNGT